MWRIKLNAKKTQLIVFTRRIRKVDLNITLFGEKIEQCDEVTLLGVTLDKRFTFRKHI
jgi:hypothetical protein